MHRQGSSLKPGKFQQGFAHRVCGYNSHMHWTSQSGERQGALRECFRGGYVLDLSSGMEAVRKPARIFERYWTESVAFFLHEYDLPAKALCDKSGNLNGAFTRRAVDHSYKFAVQDIS